MSYLEIVAWAAGVATVLVVLLLILGRLACELAWYQVEGVLHTLIVLVTFVLISGTVFLLAAATASHFSLL